MITNTFTIGSQKYTYTLGDPFTKDGDKLMRVTCPKLNIDQDFLVEDIPELLLDLPNIAHNLKQSSKRSTFLRIRITDKDKKRIEKKALQSGKTTSAYIRETLLT